MHRRENGRNVRDGCAQRLVGGQRSLSVMSERTARGGLPPNGRTEALGEAPNEVEGLGVGGDPLRGASAGVHDGCVVAPGKARADGGQRLAGARTRRDAGATNHPRLAATAPEAPPEKASHVSPGAERFGNPVRSG